MELLIFSCSLMLQVTLLTGDLYNKDRIETVLKSMVAEDQSLRAESDLSYRRYGRFRYTSAGSWLAPISGISRYD